MAGIFTKYAVVKITYPGRKRRGKGTLIKGLHSFPEAVHYAKKVAARGRISSIMGHWRDNPIACAYNLRDWGQAPKCFSMRPPESKKSPGNYPKGGNVAVRPVAATFSGYSKRRKSRR